MPSLSQQPRLSNTQEAIQYIFTLWESSTGMPAWSSPGRTAKLREFARSEPILSGALASMTSKVLSLDWQIVGGRNRVKQYQELLAHAEDGKGWQSMLGRWVQDYLNTDIGGFIELARQGKNGPVVGLYHLDSECVGLTGAVNYPVVYVPKLTSGKLNKAGGIRFRPLDYARIVDMESPDESKFGLGFCAVSRAYKAARVLLALYNYDEEKLADMPMPGLVTITGMTMPEVEAAFALYNAHRESREQAVFKGLLWLASQSSPLNPIDAKLVSFAGLPENFDREQTYSLYIYTLALDFGVDAREFWPATQSGATKGEAEVQAQKAKGKGFGQLLTSIEYTLNWNVLPEGIEFRFDRRNDDDDLAREIWRGQTINNIRKLYDPPPGSTMGLIDIDEARRLLVDAQVVPDWISETDSITLHSQDRTFPEEAPEKVLSEKLAAEEAQAKAEAAKAAAQIKQPSEENTTQIEQKAARAGLERGEDLVAINLSGGVQTLWTSRKTFLPPRRELDAQRAAAIAHLQAAGLLITEGAKNEPSA